MVDGSDLAPRIREVTHLVPDQACEDGRGHGHRDDRVDVASEREERGEERRGDAAEDLGAHVVPDLIWSLANKSLLNADATAGGTRYRFPEMVRTYARRHDQGGEVVAAARRLAAWCLEDRADLHARSRLGGAHVGGG